MAQPNFEFPEDTTVRCACSVHSLGNIPRDQQTFALASRLYGKLFCKDCSPDSPNSANSGLDLCTVTQDIKGRFALPLGGLLKCPSCASETALGNIPTEMQLESILGALAGNYKCPECSGKEAKPLTPKELLVEWLKQNGCKFDSDVKKLSSDLLLAMDVFYPHGSEYGFAIVTDKFQDGLAISSPSLKPKGNNISESKRFVLVCSAQESSAELWKLYTALSHAEKAYKTAVFEKSRALEEREIDLKKAKQNLFGALRKFLIPKESESEGVEGVEFSIDVSVSEAPTEKKDEKKRGREEQEEEVVVDLVSSEEEGEEEIVVEKKQKSIESRNRTSTVTPGRLFLKQHLSTNKEAKEMSQALQTRNGEVVQHCSKKGVTVLRLLYTIVEYLLSRNALETDKVSPPFDSKQVLINRNKHSVLVVLDDSDKRIYEAVCKRRELTENQEELLNLIHPVPELGQHEVYQGEPIPLNQEVLEEAESFGIPDLRLSWSPFLEGIILDRMSF
jgi:hypothetical protein